MHGAAAYLVAVCAMLFSALSARTLIYAVNHFDPPATRTSPTEAPSPTPAPEHVGV